MISLIFPSDGFRVLGGSAQLAERPRVDTLLSAAMGDDTTPDGLRVAAVAESLCGESVPTGLGGAALASVVMPFAHRLEVPPGRGSGGALPLRGKAL